MLSLGLSEWLLVLFGASLFAHVLMDIRALYLSIRHPNDLAWSVVTFIVLIAHIVMDYAR